MNGKKRSRDIEEMNSGAIPKYPNAVSKYIL
jgi:hypothetical protein